MLSAYHDASAFDYGYDVAAANKLLDQAGYPRQGSGPRFDLKLTLIPGADFRRSADYLRAALNRVGIRVTVLTAICLPSCSAPTPRATSTSTSTVWADCSTRRSACSASTGATV